MKAEKLYLFVVLYHLVIQDEAEPEWWCHNCRGVAAVKKKQPQLPRPPSPTTAQPALEEPPVRSNRMFAALLSVSLSHLQSLESPPTTPPPALVKVIFKCFFYILYRDLLF